MNRLLVFTKPARPGRVKTRLIGELEPAQAAALHEALLGDLGERLQGASFEIQIAWALDPGESLPDTPVAGLRQIGSDLGERLYHGLAEAAREAEAVAAVGSDHPELGRATVEEAFRRLAAGADVVLGPAEDGGYYLIGLRREAVERELFTGVAWSTGQVLGETLTRCARLGLTVELLPSGRDLDTPEDLKRLVERLDRGEAAAGPRTRALLATWGRLSPQRETAVETAVRDEGGLR